MMRAGIETGGRFILVPAPGFRAKKKNQRVIIISLKNSIGFMKVNSMVVLLVLGIVLVCLAGCTSSTSGAVPTPTATPTPHAGNATVTVTPPVANSTVTQTPPAANSTGPALYNSSAIDSHFMDIAFNNKFETIGESSTSGDTIAITGDYTDNDVSTLGNFLLQFNNNSPIKQLPAVPVQESNSGDIRFNYIPESSLDTLAQQQPSFGLINRDSSGKIGSIYKTTSNTVSNSTNAYVYRTGTVFVNNNLTGDERTHYMIRGLLYYLGFVGQTTTYPDSIFYPGPNNTITPNGIDWQAIDVMYGGTITPGMTYNEATNALGDYPGNTGT